MVKTGTSPAHNNREHTYYRTFMPCKYIISSNQQILKEDSLKQLLLFYLLLSLVPLLRLSPCICTISSTWPNKRNHTDSAFRRTQSNGNISQFEYNTFAFWWCMYAERWLESFRLAPILARRIAEITVT